MDSSSGAQRDGTTRMPTAQIVLVAALILIPILALMWVSSYAKREPELWGMPFFYWYQFCWVFVTAIRRTSPASRPKRSCVAGSR